MKLVKYVLIFFLFLLILVVTQPSYAQNPPQPTLITPTLFCLGSCPTHNSSVSISPSQQPSSSPSNASTGTPSTTTQPNPSSAPSTSPTTVLPCSTSQSSVSSQSMGRVSSYHWKHHHSAGGGFLQRLFQLLWQWLQQLFQKLGIQLPSLTSPCGGNNTTSPSGSPSQTPSAAPSTSPSGAPSTTTGQPSPSSTASQAPAPSGSGSGSTASGFISAKGTQLMLNGKPYKSLGFNFSAVGACWSGTNWTTSQMDTFFAALPANSLARFFAPPDNTDSAGFVQSVVQEADKYKIHLIISLADADVDNSCDPEDASGNGKTAAYYTNAVQPGSTYYNWVQSVVKPLANDPGVGMWEIVNEPFHSGASYSQVGAAAAENYVKTAASIIRALDKNHLITMGTVDIGETGGTSGMQTLFGYLDVVNDHDYAWDYQNKATISSDFAPEKQVAQALNKPFMVDEAGVEGGASCNGSNGLSLADRVTYLTTKANDYLSSSGGASALVIWLYTGDASSNCAYENINTSDPLMAAVKNYQMPN